MDIRQRIDAVRRYARMNYGRLGWDYIVECWSDADIAEAIERTTTEAGAIKAVGAIAKLLDDRREDVRGFIDDPAL